MNAAIETLPAYQANTKPLWAAVGVLSVAVLAMGASLVYVQTRPLDGHTALVATANTTQSEPALQPSMQQDDLVAPPKAPPVVVKPPPAKTVRAAPAHAAAAPVAAATLPAAAPAPVATKPICSNCGTVEAVTSIQRKGATAGIGAVAGGVLGAVVGNQVVKGNGRTVATILGAVGGGLAGNAIEKNVRKETAYQVRVRMEDGSTRTIEQATSPALGERVTVDSGVLHPADGNWPVSAAPRPLPQAQSPQIQNRT